MKPLAKLAGIALAIHVILIAVSFAEVALYSLVVRPGETEAFYQDHAELAGPYVSAIFGFLLFFLVVRKLVKGRAQGRYSATFWLFLIYVLIDIAILAAFSVDWGGYWATLLWANGAKLLGGFLAAYMAPAATRSGAGERS